MNRGIPTEFRAEVAARAKGRCEYCRIPDGASLFAHEVDHIEAMRPETKEPWVG
jgi:hypothetical protein